MGKLFFILFSISIINTCFAADMTINDQDMQQLIHDFRLEIQQSPTILHAPLANDYLQHLGRRLSNYAEDKEVHYAFYINQSNEINAFAGPGGTIVVNTALILATKQEDELAAVLAHEIAHSEQKHWLKDINRQKRMRVPMIANVLAAIALGVVDPALSGGVLMGGLSGMAQSNINYTRSHEEDADRIGMQIMSAAGYNPNGMINFFKQMQYDDQYHDMQYVPEILLTHPLDEVRLAEAQNRVEQLPISTRKRPATIDPNYFLFKEIIRVLGATKPATLLPYYQNRLKHDPHNFIVQYGYALTLMKLLQWQSAQAELVILLKRYPDNYYYRLAYAGSYLGLKQPEPALKILAKLESDYPDNLAILLDYSMALIQLKHCALAENKLKEALEDYPKNILLMDKLAQAQACNHETARAYLTRAQGFIYMDEMRSAGIALQSAKNSVKNDPLLMAQINAEMRVVKEKTRLKE